MDFIKDYTKIKVIYFGHDLHFLRLSREYELSGDIEIKREADYWKSMELTMMYKADISYFPSYVEIDVIHSIDASIRAKAMPPRKERKAEPSSNRTAMAANCISSSGTKRS